MNLKLVLATLTLSLTTLAMTPAMASDTQKAIEAARSAQKAAADVGFEWRDMKKMIKKAEKLAKDGKDKKAIKIANAVVMHGKAALKQAALAKSAGPRF
jgi:uncharacterized protein YabN with tetrapyrrole methylase and pyrophosphatase domain